MLICIAGRTGSGKDYLAKKLEEKGLKVLKSYTTRPRRTENEDTHTFITKEEADKITDKIAVTTINGYDYFATYTQVKENDIYVIDPNGLKTLCENLKDEKIVVIYVKANDEERKKRAVERSDNLEKELEIFNKRNDSENKQFTEFEKLLDLDAISAINRVENPLHSEIFKYVITIWSELFLIQMNTDCLMTNYNTNLIDSLYLYKNNYSISECDYTTKILIDYLQN